MRLEVLSQRVSAAKDLLVITNPVVVVIGEARASTDSYDIEDVAIAVTGSWGNSGATTNATFIEIEA